MSAAKKVDAYIKKHSRWSSSLEVLRSVFQRTELKEEVKWGSPTYTLDGKLVAGMAAFKNHYAVWFHQGVFLKDPQHKLINAQEGVTRALRQWKFTAEDNIDEDLLYEYLQEAVFNCREGKEIKPKRKAAKVTLPPEMTAAFKADKDLHAAFNKLTPGRQREYADYIAEAKRESTRQSRLSKIIPMICEGVGLNDKYKQS